MPYKDPEKARQQKLAWRKNNPEKVLESRKRYYIKNKSSYLEKSKEYYSLNKEQKLLKGKEWYEKNKEARAKSCQKWYLVNRKRKALKAKQLILQNKEFFSEKRRIYQNKRLTEDSSFKIRKNLRIRINQALRFNLKSKSTIDLLGCSIQEFKKYLSLQFSDIILESGEKVKMSFENYGPRTWHIDHIKPCNQFDLSDPLQQQECFHYTNMRPLAWYDNLSRNKKYL
jgi:hypothetical protein